MSYLAEPLGEQHELGQFDCGNGELNEWLQVHARTATGHGTRTYVLVDDDGSVVGYFAIAPHTIDREALSKRLGRGSPRQIPAVLVAKLALNRRLHGQALGGELLITALTIIVEAAQRAGGKLVVVDAIDDASAEFYAHYEFRAVPSNPHRLVRKLATIVRALDLPWP